ncbi:MAG: hypothetical protein RI907_3142 [Pseudomonadota bacterium]|jgi:amino acid adenylation domain-containing protein
MSASLDCPVLFDAFLERVATRPDATAFIFLDDAGETETPVSCGELDQRARRIAAILLQEGAQGQPVMLLYTPGVDYISALLGCIYAGCIAVPAYPPLHQRQAGRVQALIDDARAPVVLTNASWFDPALVPVSEGHQAKWLHTGRSPLADTPPWKGTPAWRPEDILVLQYTSGSTGQPKGVMLSAANLTHNVKHLATELRCAEGMSGVNWLPPYHDMGLIAGILMPIYTGLTIVTMTPASFAQRPLRWLQAMSRHKGVISGGPNASFELAIEKVTDEQAAELDLSHWHVAVNGAEPIRASTLHRFSAKFAKAGYRPSTFFPAFGMAEATLLVTGAYWPLTPRADIDPALDALTPVPLGPSLPDQFVRVVHPETCRLLPDGEEGEVWVSGASVAQGYWRQPERTAATFHARLAGEDVPTALRERHWLRTGDLGRWVDGQLQICGRMKDQINLAGRKLYPQDIEQTAQRSHPALRKHSAAAFAVPGRLRDQLVLVQELEPRAKADLNEVLATIRQALARELDVQADDIVLVKAGVVEKTSSGKVRRSTCKQAYIDGHIEPVARSQRTATDLGDGATSPTAEAPSAPPPTQAADMLAWLRSQLAQALAVGEDQVQPHHTLAELGVDSLALTRLQTQLDALGSPLLPLAELFQQPLADLAEALLPSPTQARATPHLPGALASAATPAPHAPFPLTPLQQAYLLGRGEVSAHVFAHHDISALDLPTLQAAWAALVDRHPMLRMRVADWPLQRIASAEEAPALQAWHTHDWRGLSPDAAQASLAALSAQVSHQVLPAEGPLYSLHVAHLPADDGAPRTALLMGIDMLLADATSLLTLMADWGQLYGGQALPPLTVQFADVATAQAATPEDDARTVVARTAWHARLPELPGAPELPLLAPATGGHRFQRRSLRLGAEPWAALRQQARRLGVTPAMLMLRAYAEVLGLFAREPRFTLMLTLFNRPALHPQIDRVVGDFTAVMPLGFKLSDGDFAEAVQATQADFLRHLDWQAFDGLAVQREHRRLHGSTALPLSAFVFTCLLRDEPGAHWLGEPQAVLSQTPQVWLDHQVLERDGELHIAWDAREACFPEGLLDQMFAAWHRLLRTLADQARAGHPLAPHGPRFDGRSALLSAGRTPSLQAEPEDTPPPRGALHAPFLDQARRQPQAPALRTDELTLSYADLATRSADVARALCQHGAQPNTLVAIAMDKGWEQVVAALGVSRSGAAYLPIDTELPPARMAQLLQRGGVGCVLVQAGHPVRHQLPAGLTVLEVGETPLATGSPAQLPEVPPDNLAYVIFTSGSTGEPKGVAMAHAATLNTVLDVNARCEVHGEDTVLALSALNFDLSVWDIFGTLGAGACIAMPAPDMRRDTDRLMAFVRRHDITIVNAVPALVQLMAEHAEGRGQPWPASVRWAMMSGDWIPVGLPDRLRALRPGIGLLAMGGATEAAIWSNSFPIGEVGADWPSIPYGRALRHQQMVVLDHAGHPRPTWVPGEIHIGGVGLAQGYWRDEATTAQRFVTHAHTGQRLYRTGDLGRHLPSGDIEFLGRIDHQLKVAGHRIEPGEIEHQARQVPGVRDALVTVWREGANARLVGFAVAEPDAEPSTEAPLRAALQAHLRQQLPAYMQPSVWQVLSHWPLSPNGKVDRAALMAQIQAHLQARGAAHPDDAEPADAAHMPAGAMPSRVHDLLCRTWGLDALPLHTSFLDLGLNSIDIMRGANALGQHLGVRPPIHELFNHPTVAAVAALCERLLAAGSGASLPNERPCGAQAAASEPAADAPWGPLTPSQHSLWLLEQMHPEAAAYNEPVALRLKGALNVAALQAALLDIVRRHDALRMVFALRDGQAMQRPRSPEDPSCHPAWQTFSLPDLQDDAALAGLLQPWAHRPFDLSAGPLLRVALVHTDRDDRHEPENVLVLVTHHIVTDGWSLAVFKQELAWLYATHLGLPGTGAASLPALTLSFSAHAWQQHEQATAPAQQAARAAALAHWRATLAEPLPVLALPTDRPRGPELDARGATHLFALPDDALDGLRAVASQHGSTLHVVLMAAFAVLLSRHSGQSELCLGTPSAQRDRPELEAMIGYVVDTVPLRCHVEPLARFDQLVGQLHGQMQAAREHTALSFGEVVEALQPSRHPGRPPIFQAMFAMQNTPPAAIDVAGLHASVLELGLARAKFDLVLAVTDAGRASAQAHAGLQASFTYAAALFDASTIAALAEQYKHLLRTVAGRFGADMARRPLHALQVLPTAQRDQLLLAWSGIQEAHAFTRQHPGEGASGTLLASLQGHATRTPQALALACESGTQLTHGELATRSDAVAKRLLQAGVQPGELVGLHMPRGLDQLVCVVGIWKAGCAYLPLDPTYPAERLALMADDAQVHWVLTSPAAPTDAAPPWPAAVQLLDGHALASAALDAQAEALALPTVTGEALAYVIYTSGSTGRPKGTAVRHRSVWHLSLAASLRFDLARPVRMLQLLSMSFDAAVLEIVIGWAHGGSLHLIEAATLMSPPRLMAVMRSHAVDTAAMAPSLAALLDTATLPALRTLIVGGERCPADLPQRLGPQVRLINSYGPTETTVSPTAHACAVNEASEWPQEGPPIGRPLPGATVYVMDAHTQLTPPGVPGELWVGGTGLAVGYLHRPDLTAERFVPNPFEPGQRLYRTGDLVRWDATGRLHFLGRIDQQVKVRGMRVELGEIEAALERLAGVQQAVVSAPNLRGELTLVAHVVSTADAPTADAPWRQALSQRLPMHMVPALFMRHPALPALPNGKVNRLALPQPDAAALPATPFMGPRDALELAVLQLWEEVLGRQGFGILDNFFDLGGHSLKAIRLLGRIQQAFGLNLSVSALTQTPTVEAVAAAIRAQTPPSTDSLVAVQPKGKRPPIFFVHAAGGSVMCYHELARHMSPDQPVYGLQAQGIEAGTTAAADLPAMARRYVAEVRAVQPQGPYRIAGWSMGGNIVFEMAHQLLQAGEDIALLGLLDASAQGFDDPTPVRDNAAILAEMFSNEFDVSADMLRALPQDTLIENAVALADSHQWFPPGFTVDQAHRILNVYRSSERSIKAHKPQAIACGAVLYRTHELIEGEADHEPEDRGWGPLIQGGVTIRAVPGNHINMVMPPHSKALAQAIERDLKAVLPDAFWR